MEIYTQPNNQIKDTPETSFDKQSRESYFEMLQVALENLSIVYENNSKKNGFKHKIRK